MDAQDKISGKEAADATTPAAAVQTSSTALPAQPASNAESTPASQADSAEIEELEQMEEAAKHAGPLMNVIMKFDGMKMVIFFFCMALLLYITDIVLTNMGLKNSGLSSSLFELIKLMITTLLGYVFAVSSINNQ